MSLWGFLAEKEAKQTLKSTFQMRRIFCNMRYCKILRPMYTLQKYFPMSSV